MPRALVTGAAGFIGTCIVEEFLRTGWRVRATDLPAARFETLAAMGAEAHPFDLAGGEEPGDLVEGVDAVVHCAGLFDFSAGWAALARANVDGVHRIAASARRAGVPRLVALSSTAVYGRPSVVPCPEDAPKAPRNAYERTKWLGERAALAYHEPGRFEVVGLRPTLVYGPRSRYGHANFVAVLILAKRARAPIYFIRDGRGPAASHVHVEDVARAARFAAETDGLGGESFNVVGHPEVPVKDLGEALFEGTGMTEVRRLPYWGPLWKLVTGAGLHLPGRTYRRLNAGLGRGWKRLVEKHGLVPALNPRAEKEWLDYIRGSFVYDPRRLKERGFAYQHTDFRASLLQTIAWYRENRWIP